MQIKWLLTCKSICFIRYLIIKNVVESSWHQNQNFLQQKETLKLWTLFDANLRKKTSAGLRIFFSNKIWCNIKKS